MIISKNTWHYRLASYVYGDIVYMSLCKYFWALVGAVIAFPFIIAYKSISHFTASHNYSSILIYLIVFVSLYVILAVLLHNYYFLLPALVVCILPITIFIGEYQSNRPIKEKIKEKKKKEPNIMIEFLKAKKNKICPLITFKDEEEDELQE